MFYIAAVIKTSTILKQYTLLKDTLPKHTRPPMQTRILNFVIFKKAIQYHEKANSHLPTHFHFDGFASL